MKNEDIKTTSSDPIWWEMLVFRGLNIIMVAFFLAATLKLQEDDNACLWIPTFLVPALLSSVVAVRPQLSDQIWWKAQAVIFNSMALLLALVWSIQLVRTVHAEAESETVSISKGGIFRSFGLVNPLEYEEGREMIGILLCVAWMKMTSHVSRVHFRSRHVLPAPRKLVMTSLYLSIVPVLLTLVCILRCQGNSSTCMAVIGL